MIERLAAALATTAGLSAEEVLDVLLLCGRRPLPEEAVRPDAAASSAAPPATSEPARTSTPPDAPPPVPEPVAPRAPELRLPPERADADLRPAAEAGFEAPAAISDQSALPRALRRFRRVRTRGHRLSIDIEATADATAEARGRLVLVHTQEAEHALDVVLVADDGPGMRIWDDTLDAFARLLTQSGAFRTVTRCRLAHTPKGPRLRDGRGMLHPPRYIVDPSGHRVVLVATDATAEAWYHPPVWAALATWCRAMPTAILHMLPDRYWARTAIGDPYLAARARRPGGPNQHYEQRLAWWAEAPRGVPLPVVTLAAESLWNWAEAAVDGVAWSDAISVDPPELAYAPSRADTSDPQALLNAFRALASDGAEHLAHAFAMAPVLSLPLMRILQEALVPTAGTPELAEVLASGLFRPAGHTAGDRLQFHEGVRELLAQGTTSFDEWSAYDAVTRYLGERGCSPGPLRALVADPAGHAFLDPDDRPFAEMHTHLAERFASGSGGGSSRQGRARDRGDESEHHDVRPREFATAGPTARPRAGRTGPGRRFLIAIGVGRYREPDLGDLPGAEADADRVRGLLEPMGYESVLTDRSDSPTRSALVHGMEEWVTETSLGPEDVVVVYFTGHAETHQDRHYLLGADSSAGLRSTALTAEDLARPLMTSDVGHLLVILDTCFAEARTVDIGRLAAEPTSPRRGRVNRWCLATARGLAWRNVFVDALADVFANPRHGATQQFLSMREVTERVNAHFMINRPGQQARMAAFQTDDQEPFFPSPLFIPGLPTDGIDLASVARLRHRHTGHFSPRSRGLEHAGERGDYFTGRTRALRDLSAFLSTPGRDHDRKARVVTGDPGSGKSALLGRLLALSDPEAAAREIHRVAELSPALPSLIALHAHGVTLDDLVADLASILNLPDSADRDDVLTSLASRISPVGIVVDSLDGAGTADTPGEGARVARELLKPLSTMPLVRLIVGTRRPLIPALGAAVEVIDLDEHHYADPSDIAAYARALLEDAQDPDSRSPYQYRSDLAATIADGIAERAGSSYLVARMTARALVEGQIHIDTTQPGWRERLPHDATEAFAAYLDRFGPDRPKVERLLRPLVYAQGAGLPWSTLWGPLAEALSGLPCAQDDLDWLHRHAGAYIIETPTPDGSAYRLFHETMVEHLRRPDHVQDDHAAIAGTLISLVTTDPITGLRDWPAAHPYIRRHIATHAAAGGTLPTLLDDPEYLVHAEPAPLLRALEMATGSASVPTAVYGASVTVHATMAPPARRDILAIDAARIHHPDLAARFARTRPWVPRWAAVTEHDPARRVILTSLADPVLSVATTDIDGRPYVLSSSSDDGRVRVWDLTTGTERGVLAGLTGAVLSVATTDIDGRPHAVTGNDDGRVRVWDLTTGTERGVLAGLTGAVLSVATTDIGGRPHAVTGNDDGRVRVWDLTTGTERGVLAGLTGAVLSVATTDIDGRPHAVTGNDNGTVRVWDLGTSSRRATLTGHADQVFSVATTDIDGRPHAVTGSDEARVGVWDLTTGAVPATLVGHTGAVLAVATVYIEGRPHAVTGSADSTARVWDLTTGTERAVLTGHTGAVLSVATTDIDGRPHAVTGSADSSARVWDLLSNSVVAVLSQPLAVRAVAAYGSDLLLCLADVVVMLRRNAESGSFG